MTRCGRLLLTLNFPCFCLEPQGFSDKILPTSAKWNLPTTKSELVLMRTVTWLFSLHYVIKPVPRLYKGCPQGQDSSGEGIWTPSAFLVPLGGTLKFHGCGSLREGATHQVRPFWILCHLVSAASSYLYGHSLSVVHFPHYTQFTREFNLLINYV